MPLHEEVDRPVADDDAIAEVTLDALEGVACMIFDAGCWR